MYATDLIQQLQALVNEHGDDVEVCVLDVGDDSDIEIAEVVFSAELDNITLEI